MSIAEQIAADEANVANAQAALDAAQSVLASDRAALEAIQPHLSVLAEMEQAVSEAGDAVSQTVRDGIAKLRNLLGA